MSTFPPLPQLPCKTSFRIGVTSFVHPADRLPNVQAVAPFADDIELLFFESGENAGLPGTGEIRAMGDLAREHDLTYTIHFPIDKALGSPRSSEREALLTQLLRIVDVCRPLQPCGWLLHIEGVEPRDTPERILQWQSDVLPLLDRLGQHLDHADRLCIENIDYPFAWCAPFLDRFPFSVCLDAGHLWQGGYDWRAHVARYLPRTRVIHLYGTGTGSRHFSLAASPLALVRDFLGAITGYTGVLTLETFGYDDTRSSLERLTECLT